MGNLEAGSVNRLIAVKQEIEVEGTGAVGDGGGAVAAEFALDLEQPVEKFARGQVGFKREDGVEEARLVGQANGSGGVERRALGDAAEGGEAIRSGRESGFRRPGGTGNVGAEGDVSGGHAGRFSLREDASAG